MTRSRSRSTSPSLVLSGLGVDEISEADYFQRSSEFRTWLRDEKGKYFDELTGERARHYFRKFVKAWNRGKLPKFLYTSGATIERTRPASSNTAYKWSFATENSRVSTAELKAVREEGMSLLMVGQATYGAESMPVAGASSTRRTMGPTMPPDHTSGPLLPSSSDRTLQREAEIEAAKQNRRMSNKRGRERLEDEDGGIGPKQVGREGMMEKKRAKREDDRTMRDRKEDGGLEVKEEVLMGAGSNDSFQAAIAKRNAARARWAEKKQTPAGVPNERREAMKAKEAETMAMFQSLAKQRFG